MKTWDDFIPNDDEDNDDERDLFGIHQQIIDKPDLCVGGHTQVIHDDMLQVLDEVRAVFGHANIFSMKMCFLGSFAARV